MEAGLASTHRCWQAVDTQLAKTMRVVTYDRPGYGNSPACSRPRDGITVAKELYQALKAANIPPPYVLVGWSLGGYFVRAFAGEYSSSVAGLVLVDPAPEKAYPRFEKEYPALMAEDSLYVKEVLASTDRPGEKAELISFDKSGEQAAAADGRHSTPTILLIAAGGENRKQSDPLNRIWVEELKKWAGSRPNLRYKIIGDSGHHIAKDQPAEVVSAVLTLVAEQERRQTPR